MFDVSIDEPFDLEYDEQPVRHKPTAKVAVDRLRATIEEPVRIESSPEPLEKEVNRQITLADLRGVIGL